MAVPELPLVTAMGLGRGCNALFAPLPGSCCDVFILILGCLNGCSFCCKVHVRSHRSQAIRSDGLANCSAGGCICSRSAETMQGAKDTWVATDPACQLSSHLLLCGDCAGITACMGGVIAALLVDLTLHTGDVWGVRCSQRYGRAGSSTWGWAQSKGGQTGPVTTSLLWPHPTQPLSKSPRCPRGRRDGWTGGEAAHQTPRAPWEVLAVSGTPR